MREFPQLAEGGEDAGLLAQLDAPFTAEAVFDRIAGVVYFIKNARAEYVIINRTLCERCGIPDKRRVLGRTTIEIFPPPLGRTYFEQDQKLLKTGHSLMNVLELQLYPNGSTGWCLTDKFPLRARGGAVIGLVGISQDLHQPNEEAADYDCVTSTVEYARRHLSEPLTAARLAEVAGLSAYQFDQRVRRLFRISTGQLILKFRMDAAALLLGDTARSMAAVAVACGYADQSAFARQFRRTTGLTPGEFRKFLQGDSPSDARR